MPRHAIWSVVVFLLAVSSCSDDTQTGEDPTFGTQTYSVAGTYTWSPWEPNVTAVILVVGAGGGGGGGANGNGPLAYGGGGGGGGGAGQVIQDTIQMSSGTTYTITVGTGGLAGNQGTNGLAGTSGQSSQLRAGATTIATASGGNGGGGGSGGTNSQGSGGFGGGGYPPGSPGGTAQAGSSGNATGGSPGSGGANGTPYGAGGSGGYGGNVTSFVGSRGPVELAFSADSRLLLATVRERHIKYTYDKKSLQYKTQVISTLLNGEPVKASVTYRFVDDLNIVDKVVLEMPAKKIKANITNTEFAKKL